ncbi:MAG: orotidine 5'-phosphate decarboxylase [Candidatus Micrarchaeota archaeon]|nr:orotidine 5'-phosphate decarboxylase [Candidatus Micrarchaeota archaeon]
MVTKSKVAQSKAEAIDYVIAKGSFTITPDAPRTLKSKRLSPHFLNSGMLDDGDSVLKIGKAYGQAVLEHIGAENVDVIFGPPYKGIPLSAMTAGGMMQLGVNKKFAFYRKEEKTHGEGSGLEETKEQRQKRIVVGEIKKGSRMVLVDDVLTAGGAKLEAIGVVDAVADDVKITGGVILLDRQEVNERGESTLEKFAKDNKIVFNAAFTISDVIDRLEEKGGKEAEAQRKAILNYLAAWGTPEVRKRYDLYQKPLIEGKTLIPALDVDLDRAREVVRQTKDNPKIGGYKIPAVSGYEGWAAWVGALRTELGNLDKKLIMDGQKFGNDIPDTGREIVQKLKKAGFDAVILFPFTGPNTQVAWTGEAIQAGLTVIVGSEMTHPGFLKSEGGVIDDEALLEIYRRAARQGVTHYVFPGNKPKSITNSINLIRREGIEPIGFSPGFVAQGGSISEAAKAADGISYHPIVGRGIYAQKDMAAAAKELAQGL